MGLAGDRCVAPPRRSTPGSPSSSRLALASQYPCARPFVLSPRAVGDRTNGACGCVSGAMADLPRCGGGTPFASRPVFQLANDQGSIYNLLTLVYKRSDGACQAEISAEARSRPRKKAVAPPLRSIYKGRTLK